MTQGLQLLVIGQLSLKKEKLYDLLEALSNELGKLYTVLTKGPAYLPKVYGQRSG
jgi:hypothetical protein